MRNKGRFKQEYQFVPVQSGSITLDMKSRIIILCAAFISLYLRTLASVPAASKSYDIVFVGDSITYGATLPDPVTQAASVRCFHILRQRFKMAACMSNQGHSGHTTVDWLPSKNPSSDFQLALTAADKLESNQPGQLIFSIMLGTNDSAERGPNGSPVRPADYISNMRSIMNQFLVRYPTSIIIVHHPIWYSTNTECGALFGSIGLERLKSYLPKIDGLITEYATNNPGHVFAGDKLAFDYFSSQYLADLTPESGVQGTFYLHPNIAGAVVLGDFWAEAIAVPFNLHSDMSGRSKVASVGR
jgi:hypothetical protein